MADRISTTGPAEMTVVVGFLGAGKTTFLTNFLTAQTDLSCTVVLVNEFGQVGIDGELLGLTGSEVVEMASGCICCTLQAELPQTLIDIIDRFAPERIVLEASGVAWPEAVLETLGHPLLAGRLAVGKVITLLDASFWPGRMVLGEFFTNQLTQADLILLNKIDLIDQADLPGLVAEIKDEAPGARIIPVVQGRVDPEAVVDGPPRAAAPVSPANFYLQPPDRDHAAAGPVFRSFTFRTDRRLDEARLADLLAGLPWEVFRIKGPVRLPGRTALVNSVAGQTQWQEWTGEQTTELVFIGWQLDEETIRAGLEKCVV